MKKSIFLRSLFAGMIISFGIATQAVAEETVFFSNIPSEDNGGFTWTGNEFTFETAGNMGSARFQTQLMKEQRYDTWLFSPAITVPASGELTVSFKAGCTGSVESGISMELCYGNYPQKTAMSTFSPAVVISGSSEFNKDGGNERYPTTEFTYKMSVKAGTYYLGFHNTSLPVNDFMGEGSFFSVNSITCSWESGEYVEPIKIALDKTSTEMYVGETLQLKATVTPSGTETPVTWVSEAVDFATVDANGKVTALKAGWTNIVATCGTASASCRIQILEGNNPNPVDPTDPAEDITITLDKENATIQVGETLQLTATVEPSDTEAEIKWTSSDEEVATVNSDGLVTGVSKGTATITAICGESYANCTVVVESEESGETGSVDAIIAEGATSDVYGIDGIVVLRGADAAAIRALPAGFYIVNGRKFILK